MRYRSSYRSVQFRFFLNDRDGNRHHEERQRVEVARVTDVHLSSVVDVNELALLLQAQVFEVELVLAAWVRDIHLVILVRWTHLAAATQNLYELVTGQTPHARIVPRQRIELCSED